MQIDRLFTDPHVSPFDSAEYEKHDCVIKHHQTGEVVFEYKDCLVPKDWGNNARDVLVSKYFRKDGIPQIVEPVDEADIPKWLRRSKPLGEKVGGEKDVREVIRRIVGQWTYVGFKNGYFDPTGGQLRDCPSHTPDQLKESNAYVFYDELCYVLLHQMAAPNSPQWFNTGLNWAYGLTGPAAGHWYVDLPTDTRVSDMTPVPGTNAALVHLQEASIDDAKKLLKNSIYLKRSPDAFSRVPAHACYILAVDDTMFDEQNQHGIIDWYVREARIFKFGSGSGVNVSNLRAAGEPLSGGGKSSGVMSWVKVADCSAGAIKSGGTVRRAAKMVCMDLDHPDVLDFIHCKVESEIAVAAMVAGSRSMVQHCQKIMDLVRQDGDCYENVICRPDVAQAMRQAAEAQIPASYIRKAIDYALQNWDMWPGEPYGTGYEDPAYAMVPYQNTNHSVRIPQSFYDAVDADRGWATFYRTNQKIAWTKPARNVEKAIATAAWFCGDPGVQFDTNINDWHPTPNDGPITASNACSEFVHHDGTACNLASVDLMRFYDGKTFQLKQYLHVVRLMTIALDITNTMAQLPDKDTAMGVYLYRNLGLGYCDLGALLMAMGLAYDSNPGQAVAGALTALLTAHSWKTSAEMAEQLGAYPRFAANREPHLRVLHNHLVAADGDEVFQILRNEPSILNYDHLEHAIGRDAEAWKCHILDDFRQSINKAQTTGLRNAQTTLTAPTGTISIVMGADTTGVEPMLGLLVYKTLAGGGTMVVEPSRSLLMGLRKLGVPDPEAVVEYVKQHQGRLPKDVADNPQYARVFQTALGDNAIAWEAHIHMMAAIQPFLSSGISKTINMEADASIEDVARAFRLANDLGLKSITVYRDQSKLSQPMNLPEAVTKKTVEVNKPVGVAERAMEMVKQKLMAEEDKKGFDQIVKAAKPLSPLPSPTGRMKLGFMPVSGIDVRAGLDRGTLYVHTTRYDDGRTAEIWANYTGVEGMVQHLLGILCRTANVALQNGVLLKEIIDTWEDSTFEPAGLVGGHPYIKYAKSVINLLARILDYHELGNTDTLNIMPTAKLSEADTKAVEAVATQQPKVLEKAKLTGEVCPNCGSPQYVTSGTCKKCLRCGYSGGCG